ncbi:CBS domain-containing protein [Sphingomonas sp. AX6]|uniref:CBS domain-containing protein n=1 Tax=Sphingomonas sp. AX6 TaxID=2653171 RepID=UPI0012EF09DA|nr:CBS domain-containing protein [Sphingomonas sp. AX6]VXC71723.1 Inosine-5'-monophosphate dehydrogenase [Sphingomonas sp. AX6]
MTIAAILEGKGHDAITVDSDATVADAARILADMRIGAMPVMQGGELAGIFSERDILYCLAKEGAPALDKRVAELMTAPAITVDSGTSILAALSVMTQRRIRHLPVVDRGQLVGVVSIGDLVKHRIERIEAEANAMRSYIQSA